MALLKDTLDISFAKGLDTKSDPFRVAPGNFLALSNTVFNKIGQLTKRNGFQRLPALNDSSITTLTTFNSALTAIGESFSAFSAETNTWFNKGPITSVALDTTALVRSSSSQSAQDVAVSSEGVACSVWKDSGGGCKYQVSDSLSSQALTSQVDLPSTAALPRVFVLGRYFVVTFLVTVSASTHMQYVAIPILAPNSPLAAEDLATNVNTLAAGYDGVVANNNLYLAYDATDIGGAVRVTFLDSTLQQHNVIHEDGFNAVYLTVVADTTTSVPTIWVAFKDSSDDVYAAAFNGSTLGEILAPTAIDNYPDLIRLTGTASDNVFTLIWETDNDYSFSSTNSNYVSFVDVDIDGTVGTPGIIARSVGLASKSFVINDLTYFLAAYNGAYQPTYFLLDTSGNVVCKLAYSNGGGYPTNAVLPGANVEDTRVKIGYLLKDFLASVNKTQGDSSPGVYSQTGINLATFNINNSAMITAEIGKNLHLSGGFLWMYDGIKPVEHSFHLWPEDIGASITNSGGSMAAQQYYYQVTYEWTDAQGNLHRSAPSTPVGALLTMGSSKVTLNIPTLRLTYKTTPNPVRIVIYRWSTAQQTYYQVTSITSPLLNNPAVDSVQYEDTHADSAILGNVILYTTGGVIENIAAPACKDINLYKSRLFLVDAEDENLLWYSKQVIEGTPVEMSDLFTLFIAPTVGAQGSTGAVKVIAPMDDKNIFFKSNAIYYNVGTGPDNTGGNNDFSDPVFITSTVGCSNPSSIVFMPQGLMFESDKGIWLLGRDLSTQYIGAPVQEFTDGATVLSAVNVPGTNQVRFMLDSGITLMYDYYYGQWGTFTNIPAISSTLYQGLHTFINEHGQIYQENPGSYLDGSKPVLMSFTTGWMNLAGLQGFERAYMFYLLGTYLTPHKLSLQIAYDYNPSPTQTVLITPDNYSGAYGSDPLYGSGSPYGGPSSVEQWRVFLSQQKCQAFQIKFTEVYDSTFGVTAGGGLTLSGLNLVVGLKKKYTPLKSARSAG